MTDIDELTQRLNNALSEIEQLRAEIDRNLTRDIVKELALAAYQATLIKQQTELNQTITERDIIKSQLADAKNQIAALEQIVADKDSIIDHADELTDSLGLRADAAEEENRNLKAQLKKAIESRENERNAKAPNDNSPVWKVITMSRRSWVAPTHDRYVIQQRAADQFDLYVNADLFDHFVTAEDAERAAIMINKHASDTTVDHTPLYS